MLAKSEPIIFAVDLDETIYDSEANGIVYLVNIENFFSILRNSKGVSKTLGKDFHLCVITAKNKPDDLVEDFISQTNKFFSGGLQIHFVGNYGDHNSIALRKLDTIKTIAQEFYSSLNNIIFIDDNETNIEYAKFEGVRCILAHNNHQNSEAKTKMIKQDVLKHLKGIADNFINTEYSNSNISNQSTSSTLNTSSDESIGGQKFFPVMPIFSRQEYMVTCDGARVL